MRADPFRHTPESIHMRTHTHSGLRSHQFTHFTDGQATLHMAGEPQPQKNGLQCQEGRDLREQLGDSGAASTALVLGVGQALPIWVAASQGLTSVLSPSLSYSTHSAAFQTLLSTQSLGPGPRATFPDPLPLDLRRKQSLMEAPSGVAPGVWSRHP